MILFEWAKLASFINEKENLLINEKSFEKKRAWGVLLSVRKSNMIILKLPNYRGLPSRFLIRKPLYLKLDFANFKLASLEMITNERHQGSLLSKARQPSTYFRSDKVPFWKISVWLTSLKAYGRTRGVIIQYLGRISQKVSPPKKSLLFPGEGNLPFWFSDQDFLCLKTLSPTLLGRFLGEIIGSTPSTISLLGSKIRSKEILHSIVPRYYVSYYKTLKSYIYTMKWKSSYNKSIFWMWRKRNVIIYQI